MRKPRFFKKAAFLTIITLIIGLMSIPTVSVNAARGGRSKEKRPNRRGRSRIINNVVELIITVPVVKELPKLPVVSGNCAFEKGDAIFRKFDMSPLFRWIDWLPLNRRRKAALKRRFAEFRKMGHAGLYNMWEPDELNKPEIRANHKTIESHPGDGPHHNDFQKFLDAKDFWGVRTSDRLDYEDRQKIIVDAESQIDDPDVGFNFFEGYKSPGKSFRCDGLVEWCYEEAGIDIVPNPDWWSAARKGHKFLCPNIQMRNLQEQNKAIFPTLTFGKEDEDGDEIYGPIEIGGEEVEPDEDGKYKVHGEEVKIKIYASDIDKDNDGSGITRLELWVGEPDDTPDEMPGLRLLRDNTDYPADNDYVYYWDTTEKDDQGDPLFPNGDYTLKAVAFDQAGNTKETYIDVKIEELSHYFHVQLSPEYVETGSPVSQTQTFTIKVQCYNYGTSVNPPPEGMVNKLSGTESYVKNADGEWEKERINPDCQPPEASWLKSDYAEEVSFGINTSRYELYAGGGKLEKLELVDGAGLISGVVIKAEDGNIGDNHLFLIISASDGAGSGNNALMVNPVVVTLSASINYYNKQHIYYTGIYKKADWNVAEFDKAWHNLVYGYKDKEGWIHKDWVAGSGKKYQRFESRLYKADWVGGQIAVNIGASKFDAVYDLSKQAIGYAPSEIEKAWMKGTAQFKQAHIYKFTGSIKNITTGEVGTYNPIDESHGLMLWQNIPISDFGESERKYEFETTLNTESDGGAYAIKPVYETWWGPDSQNPPNSRNGIRVKENQKILFIPKSQE